MSKFKAILMGFGVFAAVIGTAVTASAKMSDGETSETMFDGDNKPTLRPTEKETTVKESVTETLSETMEVTTTETQAPTIIVIPAPTEETTEEPTITAKVTQVISGNNLDNWGYQPLASEVSALFANIYKHGFDYVDSRYFDIGRASNVVSNGVATTGYDLGIIDSKSGNSWSSSKATSATVMSSNLIVMAIYKFYGIYEYDYTVEYSNVSDTDIMGGEGNLLLEVGEPYNSLDMSEGLAKVYISNSEPTKYLERYASEFGGVPGAGSFKECLKTIYKMTKQLNGLLLSEDALDELCKSNAVKVTESSVEDKRVQAYFLYMGYIKDTEWNADAMSFGRFLEILNNIKNGSYNDVKTSKVTIVKSVNRFINGCYYIPDYEEIPNLTDEIQQRGPFTIIYTGQFNTKGSSAVDTSKITETSRALEILGYDMLLKSESLEVPKDSSGVIVRGDDALSLNQKIEGTDRYPYEAELIGDSEKITKGVAIMDIYKALELNQYDIQMWTREASADALNHSPAILNLPAYIDTIDASKGYTYVWVTRTNVNKYVTKAQNDLKIPSSTYRSELTSGEFIVLLAEMMDYYHFSV